MAGHPKASVAGPVRASEDEPITASVARPTGGAATKAEGARAARQGTDWVSGLPFVLLHLSPLAILATGFSAFDALLAAGLYVVRMFFITAGYHRYFSHRCYRLSRPAQFAMAVGGITAAQKGPLWWAAHHRRHHRYTDTPRDPHSPKDGFWWSHAGWILSRHSKESEWEAVPDLARFPELRLVDRLQAVGPWAVALVCLGAFGWGGLMAFCVSTVALWHATFAVNSFAHRFGSRRYPTADTSRNCWPVALLTLGEGWHNNHHRYPPAVRQGHRWWELDLTWYGLRALAVVGLVQGMRPVPRRVLEAPSGRGT